MTIYESFGRGKVETPWADEGELTLAAAEAELIAFEEAVADFQDRHVAHAPKLCIALDSAAAWAVDLAQHRLDASRRGTELGAFPFATFSTAVQGSEIATACLLEIDTCEADNPMLELRDHGEYCMHQLFGEQDAWAGV